MNEVSGCMKHMVGITERTAEMRRKKGTVMGADVILFLLPVLLLSAASFRRTKGFSS